MSAGLAGLFSSLSMGLQTTGDRGFLSIACAGGALLCTALQHAARINSSFAAIAGASGIVFSLSALVMTAVTKIFSEMGWDTCELGKFVKWAFIIVYPITLSVATIKGFQLASTIGESISLTVVAITGVTGVVFLAASIALLVDSIMQMRQERIRANAM